MEQCASTASLLASVREQERQFEMLSRALEEERRSCAGTLPRPLPNMQSLLAGGFPLLGHECYVWKKIRSKHQTISSQWLDNDGMEPGQLVQETFTMEEPQQVPPVISVETDDDGTTRRTETTVKKVVKTTTTRTVIPSVSDTLSVDGGGSLVGGYASSMAYRPGPGGAVPMEYPTHTVPRNYHYGPPGGYDDYRGGPPSEAFSSLSRGARMDDRYRPVHADGYRTLDPSYRAPSRNQLDPYAAQPQLSSIPRFVADPYGLEDDQRSIGYDEPDYGMGHSMHYNTMPLNHAFPHGPPPRRTGSYEGALDGAGEVYYYGAGAPLAKGERGSVASLDALSLRKGPPASGWRQPELPEVIAMLNYRLDPVRSNAAAYLQHLTFKNDKVKSDVRRLKGIPALVSMLDNPNREVHFAACGALKNISFGKDADNKIAIKNCDGVPALIRLLRKTRDQDLTEIITGTLWNLSSQDSVKMEIVDNALHALCDEVMVPHSGWERTTNGAGGGEEDGKPRTPEWDTALTNTAGCLRNVSSERIEARRKLRECSGLVDSLMYIVQSQINCKELNNKLTENCVCLLRNLSYHVHKEIPNFEAYDESKLDNSSPAPSSQRAGCFSSRKGKDEWFSKGRKDEEAPHERISIPPRATPAKGYELLFQPEVVRIYTSLLKESSNPIVLEASAGAIQNLCAGKWTHGRYIRALMREEKSLVVVSELLDNSNDRVVRAMSGAIRNLAIDPQNRKLLAKYAIPYLVADLPGGGQNQPVKALKEETVVSILSTLHEVLGTDVEAAKTLRASQGNPAFIYLTLGNSNRSDREVRGAGLVLQSVWAHKELRRTLEKDGWRKTDFMVNLNPPKPDDNRLNGRHDDSTLPLIDKVLHGFEDAGGKRDEEMIPLNEFGPDAYSTLDQRGRKNTLDKTLDAADQDSVQGGMYGERQASLPLLDSYDG
uniref:Catenin delta 1 n=1 Tax=Poecilia formosa TaxID=48698 RepID=A0A096LUU1_POEFO